MKFWPTILVVFESVTCQPYHFSLLPGNTVLVFEACEWVRGSEITWGWRRAKSQGWALRKYCSLKLEELPLVSFSLFSISFLFSFYCRERGREGETEGEKHWCEEHPLVASHMCPDLGLNSKPRHVPWLGIEPVAFALCDDTQPTEPYHLGPAFVFSMTWNLATAYAETTELFEHLMKKHSIYLKFLTSKTDSSVLARSFFS